ncbi:MAG: amidase [Thermaerobacter sp.]|nr:amidase [Thermaerobacter sp.]
MALDTRECALASVPELLVRFSAKDWTPEDLLAAQLDRADRWEPSLRAYLQRDDTRAAAAAALARDAWRTGAAPPLCGVSVGVKDLFDVAGLRTTGGSQAYGDAPAHRDAQAVALARAAGAIPTGKLNTEELAFGVISAPTRNPFDLARIPGGSSGGNAAALAAGMVSLAIGSDTAGSIRIPAALCGVVGLKPTAGRVSRQGAMPLSYTLDHAGPMARDVASVEALFQILAAYDPEDPLSLPALPAPAPQTRRLGVPRAWIEETAAPDVRERFQDALALLGRLGYAAVDVDWPEPEEFIGLQMRIRGPETLHVHEAALQDRPGRFGPGLVERIRRGAAGSARDYVDAQAARHALTRRLERAMEEGGLDGLCLPTTPGPAPGASQDTMVLRDGRERTVREALILYTAPFNVTGWPAISLPMGLDGDGLPLGLQLVGRRYEDERLLARALQLEAILPRIPYPEPPR